MTRLAVPFTAPSTMTCLIEILEHPKEEAFQPYLKAPGFAFLLVIRFLRGRREVGTPE